MILGVLVEERLVLDGENFLARVFCAEGNVLDGVGFGEFSFDEFAVLLQFEFLVFEFEGD